MSDSDLARLIIDLAASWSQGAARPPTREAAALHRAILRSTPPCRLGSEVARHLPPHQAGAVDAILRYAATGAPVRENLWVLATGIICASGRPLNDRLSAPSPWLPADASLPAAALLPAAEALQAASGGHTCILPHLYPASTITLTRWDPLCASMLAEWTRRGDPASWPGWQVMPQPLNPDSLITIDTQLKVVADIRVLVTILLADERWVPTVYSDRRLLPDSARRAITSAIRTSYELVGPGEAIICAATIVPLWAVADHLPIAIEAISHKLRYGR